MVSIGLLRAGLWAGAGAEDPATTAYVAAMSTPATAGRRALINELVLGLKADEVWTLLDWLALMAAETEQAGRINLRNPAKLLTAVNIPTFTTDRGFTGDGATSYLHTGELPNAGGNVFAQDSAHGGLYCNQQTGSGNRAHLGQVTGSSLNMVPSSNSAGSGRINDGTNISIPNAATRLGFRIITRTGATARQLYLNGVEVANDTTASTGVPGSNMCVGRSASAYSGDRFAALVLGGGLSAPQADAVNDRVTAYLTAIGAN